MKIVEYKRKLAVDYAKKWAYDRNPKYYNYDLIGGDCTNFISQCIFTGANVMNYKKDFGWYYKNANNKSPSWTGVEFLYKFLITNKESGPFGEERQPDMIEKGDIIQVSFDGKEFVHSTIVIDIKGHDIYIAAHSHDVYGKNVFEYNFSKIRCIHIMGVRV